MAVVDYSERMNIKISEKKSTLGRGQSGTIGMGGVEETHRTNTLLSLALVVIYLIKFWYSVISDTIVKIMG